MAYAYVTTDLGARLTTSGGAYLLCIVSEVSFPEEYANGAAVQIEDTGQTITNPDLHRTIMEPDSGSTASTVYRLRVQGVYSYRIAEMTTHDEYSDDSEIP